MLPTITHTRRRSSRRSSTAPITRTASAVVADARQWGRGFFTWYNDQHHHTGLALLTPATVHTGRAETVRQQRQVVLQQAYQAHPERCVRGRPQPTKLPEAVWSNPPPNPADLSAPAPQTATAEVAAAPGTEYSAELSVTFQFKDRWYQACSKRPL
jgi:hypothetical protein